MQKNVRGIKSFQNFKRISIFLLRWDVEPEACVYDNLTTLASRLKMFEWTKGITMSEALFLIGMFFLIETIFVKFIPIASSKSKFLYKIKSVSEKNKVLISSISIVLLVTSFILKEFERNRQELLAVKRENKILKFESKIGEYKNKLNDANSTTKSITVSYSVNFQIPHEIFYRDVVAGPTVAYAKIGPNVLLKSSGISFRFIPLRNKGEFIIENNAGLTNGDFPHGNNVDMFKSYKKLSIYIPFTNNRERILSFKVTHYSISIKINGIKLAPIINFEQKQYPINSGAYTRGDNEFGTITHYFKNNFYDDLQLESKLKSF